MEIADDCVGLSEAVMEGDCEKKDRKKKRKSVFEKDEKESEKARKKKRKKDKAGVDFGLKEEAVDGEENLSVEKKDKKKKKKKKKKAESGEDDEKEEEEGNDAVDEAKMEADKDKKKRKKKKKKNKDEIGGSSATDDGSEEAEKDKKKRKKKNKNEDEIDGIVSGNVTEDGSEEAEKGKRRKKKKNKNEDEIDEIGSGNATVDGSEEVEKDKKKRKKKKKNKNEDEIDAIGSGNATEDGSEEAEKDKKKKKKKKKKAESVGDDLEDQALNDGVEATNQSGNRSSKGKSKKVSFADQVEVFPTSSDKNETNENKEPELIRGKRFTKEEDAILKEAVLNYLGTRGLGEEDIDMVLNCRSHKEVKGCWKEIGAALPQRHNSSVYHRVRIIFDRDESSKWTEAEHEAVRKHVEKHGNQWKPLAGALGKNRLHVKDAWRRRRLENRKRGQWSQEEYQTLFDLVNLDLCMKATEEKKSKHGMLRDNICWEAISDKLSTRAFAACCSQWYYKLASPMVAEGKWADVDDYRMLDALSSLDPCCMEDVEWDDILEHRSGDICRKRWSQMVQHIGHHGSLSFPEQVETLAHRYRPDMVEARETFDAKPYVDVPK